MCKGVQYTVRYNMVRSQHAPISFVQRPTTRLLYEASLQTCLNLDATQFDKRLGCTPGPRSILERFQWHSWVWALLTDDEKDRLIGNLIRMSASSHFTAIGAFDIFLCAITREVNKHVLHPISPPRSTHVCDKDASRRRILLGYDEHVLSHHCFENILDRLPMEDREEFLKTVPGAKDSRDVRKQKNEEGRKFIMDLYTHRGHEFNTSFCSRHGRQCPLFKKEPTAWHGSESEEDDPEEQLTVHGAGVICKDASAAGSGYGDAGQYMHLQNMWCAERLHRCEDVIFCECTPRWEAKTIMSNLPSNMQGHTALLYTSDAGEQVRRDRRELTVHNTERVSLRV